MAQNLTGIVPIPNDRANAPRDSGCAQATSLNTDLISGMEGFVRQRRNEIRERYIPQKQGHALAKATTGLALGVLRDICACLEIKEDSGAALCCYGSVA